MQRSCRYVAVSLCAIFIGAASAVYGGADNPPVGQGQMVGQNAPVFRVQGIYSETYSLEQFKGHILVIQFGSSW